MTREQMVEEVRKIGAYHRPVAVSVTRDTMTCQCGHETANRDGLEQHRSELIVDLLMGPGPG